MKSPMLKTPLGICHKSVLDRMTGWTGCLMGPDPPRPGIILGILFILSSHGTGQSMFRAWISINPENGVLFKKEEASVGQA
jgi:hypothetical protein